MQNFQLARGEALMKNRAGEYVTNLSGKMDYKSFKPNPLPPNPPVTWDAEIVEYFVKAILFSLTR